MQKQVPRALEQIADVVLELPPEIQTTETPEEKEGQTCKKRMADLFSGR